MTATTERVVETRSGLVKVRVHTAGEGPALLFLHGLGGLRWEPFLDLLAPGHTVIAPEHPGSGESLGLEHLYGIWDLVLHYDDLLDELGLENVAVVGHSFGGMVAAEFAANSPRRVTALALLAPLGLWREEHPVPDFDSIPPDQRARTFFADPTHAVPDSLNPAWDDPMALFQADLTSASINQFIWPLPDKGLERRLDRITAPTLLVWGSHDRIVDPSYGQIMGQKIHDARMETVENAGHLLQTEQPEAVASLVNDHFAARG